MNRNERLDAMFSALEQRILLLDGAMGTMIQGYGLGEDDYRGERFADWGHDLKGNNDLLSITQPQVVREIHDAFLDAGADIIETNTFNANSVALADYQLQSAVREINLAAARVACEAADAATARVHGGRGIAAIRGLWPEAGSGA